MRKEMAKLYKISSILMAALFLASASVQFNDPDWYLWIPLYCCAAYTNLMRSLASCPSERTTATGKLTLGIGIFLLSKVILEDKFGIWSLDMRHRLVREKIGSVLVISSLILQLLLKKDPYTKKMNIKFASHVEYGMTLLVGISYGLSLVFLVYQEKEMQF
ncbi:uncharacterized protein LOC104895981 [Beta vulgaris subsp. vulgaris]|uniref:uncharacterized protein LOC104895981 n=1 Tax=Beta vulgaris subsp. vulgaris TaxID=3555 RepID=UPI002036F7FE|nr:uncharacterized protein LOC104895981 [Beta vulgaris subsp. vulgaris]